MISHSDTFILLQSSLIFGHTFSLFFYKYISEFCKKAFCPSQRIIYITIDRELEIC